MQRLSNLYEQTDQKLTDWMAIYGILLLRICLGIVFLWFGFLKFFPELSPAEGLVAATIPRLTFGLIRKEVFLPILATWECLIGIGLITGKFTRTTLFLLFTQMIGTVTPIFLFPDKVFTHFPYALTLEGQYIIKNIVLVSAGIVIGATVRGGAIISDGVIVNEMRDKMKHQIINNPQ